MRINVLAEELTGSTEIVTATAADEQLHYGVRLHIKHSDGLLPAASHVTLWVANDDDGNPDFDALAECLDGLCARLTEAHVQHYGEDTPGLDMPNAQRHLHSVGTID